MAVGRVRNAWPKPSLYLSLAEIEIHCLLISTLSYHLKLSCEVWSCVAKIQEIVTNENEADGTTITQIHTLRGSALSNSTK